MDKIFTSLPEKEKAYWETLKKKTKQAVAGNYFDSQDKMEIKEWKGYRFLPLFEPETAKRAYEEMEIEEGTVLIATFLKTGTTWALDIVRQILYGHDESLMEICKAMTIQLYYLETNTPPKLDLLKHIALPRKVFGTHLPEELINVKKIKKSKGKIIVMVRNPKDQAVSWYHFTKDDVFFDVIRDQFSSDWNKFILDYMSGKQPAMTKPGEWYPDHLLGWYKHRNDDSVLFVHYEDVKKNPAMQVKRIAKFLDVELAENRVSQIVRATSFDAMKKEQDARDSFEAKSRSAGHICRKGQVGAWKDTFTVAQSEQMDKILEEKLAGYADLKFKYE